MDDPKEPLEEQNENNPEPEEFPDFGFGEGQI